MNGSEFEKVVDEQMEFCKRILFAKGKEYTKDDNDRLANFKKAGLFQAVTPREALFGMLTKHIVSIYDMGLSIDTYPLALWEEKMTDAINYLLLLKALLIEEREVRSNENQRTIQDCNKIGY